MENILEKIEELIDDIERDHAMTKTEIIETLYKMKEELEQNQLNEDNHSMNWDDLEY